MLIWPRRGKLSKMVKSVLWIAAIILLPLVIHASSDVFVVQVGSLNECGSAKNVALQQITAVCSNGTNYCSEGDTVVVSVTGQHPDCDCQVT